MQLHIFGENKSYKHFYQQRLAYKKQKVCQSDGHDRQQTNSYWVGSFVKCKN